MERLLFRFELQLREVFHRDRTVGTSVVAVGLERTAVAAAAAEIAVERNRPEEGNRTEQNDCSWLSNSNLRSRQLEHR